MVSKTVKVTDKGQISIPTNIRQLAGIEKGDELLIVFKGNKLLIEKVEIIEKQILDNFKDVLKMSEETLKKIWDNEKDEIWNKYLENGG